MGERSPETAQVCPTCRADLDEDICACPDDVFWARLLGDNDPCAPGKDWVAAAFGDLEDDDV